MPSWIQRLAYGSLVPAVVVVPAWLVCGSTWMGGMFGWYHAIFLLPLSLGCLGHQLSLVLLLYPFLSPLSSVDNHHCPASDIVSPALAVVLLLYYATHVLFQICLEDGGDGCFQNCPSCTKALAMCWFGVSEPLAERVTTGLFHALWLGAVVSLGLAIRDRKAKVAVLLPRSRGGEARPGERALLLSTPTALAAA